MKIQIDTREHESERKRIMHQFDKLNVDYFIEKLDTGDYLDVDNPSIVVDRKKGLSEICGNLTHDHDRFRRECIRAQEEGKIFVVLCETAEKITCGNDVKNWVNPRAVTRKKINGVWIDIKNKVMNGERLYKIMVTMSEKYHVYWRFCKPKDIGERIVRILKGDLSA